LFNARKKRKSRKESKVGKTSKVRNARKVRKNPSKLLLSPEEAILRRLSKYNSQKSNLPDAFCDALNQY
jgi:hypothetical protein